MGAVARVAAAAAVARVRAAARLGAVAIRPRPSSVARSLAAVLAVVVAVEGNFFKINFYF